MEEEGPSAKVRKIERPIINLTELIVSTLTEEKGIQYLQEKLLLPKSVDCPKCGDKLEKLSKKNRPNRPSDYFYFPCHKRSCRVEIPLRKNTWFENTKLSFRKALVLTYCFVKKFSYIQAIEETSGSFYGDKTTSTETVADIYSYCREVCVDTLFSGEKVKKIGGINCTVEIDEAKFGKRKYNRGRVDLPLSDYLPVSDHP